MSDMEIPARLGWESSHHCPHVGMWQVEDESSRSLVRSLRGCQIISYPHKDITYCFFLFGCIHRSDDLLWERQTLQMTVPPDEVDVGTTLDDSKSGGIA